MRNELVEELIFKSRVCTCRKERTKAVISLPTRKRARRTRGNGGKRETSTCAQKRRKSETIWPRFLNRGRPYAADKPIMRAKVSGTPWSWSTRGAGRAQRALR